MVSISAKDIKNGQYSSIDRESCELRLQQLRSHPLRSHSTHHCRRHAHDAETGLDLSLDARLEVKIERDRLLLRCYSIVNVHHRHHKKAKNVFKLFPFIIIQNTILLSN